MKFEKKKPLVNARFAEAGLQSRRTVPVRPLPRSVMPTPTFPFLLPLLESLSMPVNKASMKQAPKQRVALPRSHQIAWLRALTLTATGI